MISDLEASSSSRRAVEISIRHSGLPTAGLFATREIFGLFFTAACPSARITDMSNCFCLSTDKTCVDPEYKHYWKDQQCIHCYSIDEHSNHTCGKRNHDGSMPAFLPYQRSVSYTHLRAHET